MSFTLSPSLTAVASPAIGGRVSRTASKGFGDPGSRLLVLGRKKPETTSRAKWLISMSANQLGARNSEQLRPTIVETFMGEAKKL
jgi:hypothetical protein